jgi:hypothetical protein
MLHLTASPALPTSTVDGAMTIPYCYPHQTYQSQASTTHACGSLPRCRCPLNVLHSSHLLTNTCQHACKWLTAMLSLPNQQPTQSNRTKPTNQHLPHCHCQMGHQTTYAVLLHQIQAPPARMQVAHCHAVTAHRAICADQHTNFTNQHPPARMHCTMAHCHAGSACPET